MVRKSDTAEKSPEKTANSTQDKKDKDRGRADIGTLSQWLPDPLGSSALEGAS